LKKRGVKFAGFDDDLPTPPVDGEEVAAEPIADPTTTAGSPSAELSTANVPTDTGGLDELAVVKIQAQSRKLLALKQAEEMRRIKSLEKGKDEILKLFLAIDKNGDGSLTRGEIMKTLNSNDPEMEVLARKLCKTLGLPAKVTGAWAREVFEIIFDVVDSDNTQSITASEVRTFVEMTRHVFDMHADALPAEFGGDRGADSEGAHLLSAEVKEALLLLATDADSKTGAPTQLECIRVLGADPNVRAVVSQRIALKVRFRSPMELAVEHVVAAKAVGSRLRCKFIKQHNVANTDWAGAPVETEGAQTEEELLDAELRQRPLSEEDVALKATEVRLLLISLPGCCASALYLPPLIAASPTRDTGMRKQTSLCKLRIASTATGC
jgi:Ca2+-binding EF-hand superfamily protein